MHTSTKRTRVQDADYRSPSRSSSSSPTPTPKALRLSPSTESQVSSAERAPLLCTLPPTCHPPRNAPTRLANSSELEAHYAKYHAFVCEDRGCSAVFPNARLLELHQTECHDPLADVRKERGEKIFACHLETCDRLFLDPKKRRLHLIQAHGYPKEYFFAVTNKGVGGLLKKWGDGASLIRNPWKRRDNEVMDIEDGDNSGNSENEPHEMPSAEVDESELRLPQLERKEQMSHEADLNTITNSMDSLSLVPPNIRFGRGGKRRNLVHDSQHMNMRKNHTKKPEIRVIPGETDEGTESNQIGSVSINIDGALEALKAEIPRPPALRPNDRGMLHIKGGTSAYTPGISRGRGSGRARSSGRGRGRAGPPRGRGQA